MSTLGIVALVLLALLALLALGGAITVRRRRIAGDAQFHARVEQANRELAEAHAADNGWEPGRVEAAARRAFAERQPGVEIAAVSLVQVVDPPGTEDDKAIFRIETPGAVHEITLGRRGDEWIAEDLASAAAPRD